MFHFIAHFSSWNEHYETGSKCAFLVLKVESQELKIIRILSSIKMLTSHRITSHHITYLVRSAVLSISLSPYFLLTSSPISSLCISIILSCIALSSHSTGPPSTHLSIPPSIYNIGLNPPFPPPCIHTVILLTYSTYCFTHSLGLAGSVLSHWMLKWLFYD